MKPLLKVVLSVFAPWLTGVAKLLVIGLIEFNAARLRKLRCRLRARFREAIVREEGGTRGVEGEGKSVLNNGEVQGLQSSNAVKSGRQVGCA